MRSTVAAKVGAAEYDAVETRTTTYYGYWDGVRAEGFEAYFHPTMPRVVLAFPTNDGLVVTFIQWPRAEFSEVRADPERSMRDAIALMPGLAERFAHARLAERPRGTADHPNFFRRPFGRGWALVGDAGYHRDSLTAQGIKDAFRSADLLASALHAVLAEAAAEDAAMGEYERSRNEAVRPAYDATCRMISFPPPSPEAIRLRTALQHDQDAVDQYCGVMFDTVPAARFFAPENVARIIARVPAEAPVTSAD